ncbi:FMN-dependent NADH-azoreductase [Aliishimia ponticola]|uniref:FMN dependent NADH:quinone oxidoreductase n=1 Tax=Aliishimia ponticola TaxID=2499833 RepID=A0A4S4N7G8_9RHOB|nr:NAD(P)H-dependent oxidoreductase [Aliishimia ponticola]THH35084.1 FMN-dependent NADH-azoreductase [Aliishimia ponticola]
MTLLHIDSSARRADSTTRRLTAQVVTRLGGAALRRDLADALPQLTEAWVGANLTRADERDALQADVLALSDTLIAELQAADTVVIGVPMYNFGIPASLKAWIDLVARAGVTFRYSEAGPEGLLTGKRAILVIATGGTPVGSNVDFATGYMRHVLGFLGITDVTVIQADQMAMAPQKSLAQAEAQIAALAA